ncbi:calcium/sodium antiporter [Sabulicella glaciei]|uniref:Calcium/sodium antiporter n=1 Tax=Sabulicella glaciei TaxID=2984948 RepID=A0ABT3P1P6_9PROT|nr:calcium/sodium antiporter [Roseococcus sp. MDT2-1-1]MCW8088327.1 calcium/sodium antiporter [Roseococcus sp. MDT2-1-1]
MDTALLLLGGLALLALGGEFLVRGAVRVAERIGVSPLLIGLTLVGFGTSTPELVTSVQAALAGSPGIAVGNVVGSNIANVLLILGIAALLSPIRVSSGALGRDGVLGAAAALAVVVIGFTLPLGRTVGALLLAALVAYLVHAWRTERAGTDGHSAAYEKAEAFEGTHPTLHAPAAGAAPLLVSLGMALGGLVLVVVGGRLMVDGAVALAQSLGISETVIGLTIVAVGTSMPELVTSLVAAVRRQSDVALGNVLGSNIYNVLGILGVTAVISPTVVPPEIARFDSPVMLTVSLALLVFAWTGLRIGRREGGVLIAAYVAYVWWIWPA